MTLRKIAYSQSVLRAQAQAIEKQAVIAAVGKWAVNNPMKALNAGFGTLGSAASVNSGYQKAREVNSQFNPAVMQAKADGVI